MHNNYNIMIRNNMVHIQMMNFHNSSRNMNFIESVCFLVWSTLYSVKCQLDKDNYGPYIATFLEFDKCKGPKQNDCGKYEIADRSNMSDVLFKFDYDNDCPVTSARVTISALQSNKKPKKLFNYALDKPCQHFVLGPILIGSFNLTNSCKINKGQYDIHLNMMDKSTMFLGPNFFYGNYNFKVTAMNKVNNFICVNTILSIEKKTGS